MVAAMNAPTPIFGDEEMTERTHIQVREEEANLLASREDFHTIFNENLKGFYQLSLLLTRDPAKAERCFVDGLEDCVTGNRVFREWARSWAKRTIVRNAIRGLNPRPSQSNSPLSGGIFPNIYQLSRDPGGHFEIDAVLRLPISIGLCSSCPSWSITRNTTVPFSSGAPLETFGRVGLVP